MRAAANHGIHLPEGVDLRAQVADDARVVDVAQLGGEQLLEGPVRLGNLSRQFAEPLGLRFE